MTVAPTQDRLDVLCLGAHPDDIEIGCGGTLLGLRRGPAVTVAGLVLTGDGERKREAESALPRFFPGATVEVLGLPDSRLPAHWEAVKSALESFAARATPTLILAPSTDDAHQDHRLLGRLATTVWRDVLTLHYEIPKWDGDLRTPNHYVHVSAENARLKVGSRPRRTDSLAAGGQPLRHPTGREQRDGAGDQHQQVGDRDGRGHAGELRRAGGDHGAGQAGAQPDSQGLCQLYRGRGGAFRIVAREQRSAIDQSLRRIPPHAGAERQHELYLPRLRDGRPHAVQGSDVRDLGARAGYERLLQVAAADGRRSRQGCESGAGARSATAGGSRRWRIPGPGRGAAQRRGRESALDR